MQAAGAGSFFQLLVELLKVEISLLLNDALSIMHASSTSPVDAKASEPIHASPLQPKAQTASANQHANDSSGRPSASRERDSNSDHAQAASPSMDNSDSPASSSPDVLPVHRHASTRDTISSQSGVGGSPGSGTSGQTAEAPPAQGPAVHSRRSMEDTHSLPSDAQQTDIMPAEALPPQEPAVKSTPKVADSSSMPAEARVTDVLPAVFSLLEGCLEALAADAQVAELPEEDRQAAATLDDKVAQRAMQALSEAFETVLQFLELVHTEGLRSQDSPWVVAAVRAYGRQVERSVCTIVFR